MIFLIVRFTLKKLDFILTLLGKSDEGTKRRGHFEFLSDPFCDNSSGFHPLGSDEDLMASIFEDVESFFGGAPPWEVFGEASEVADVVLDAAQNEEGASEGDLVWVSQEERQVREVFDALEGRHRQEERVLGALAQKVGLAVKVDRVYHPVENYRLLSGR